MKRNAKVSRSFCRRTPCRYIACWFLPVLLFLLNSPAPAENSPNCRLNGPAPKQVTKEHLPTCYDWKGRIIPCDFSGQYVKIMFGGPIPHPRFSDNHDGTVTDQLTGLIWLKNAGCFGKMNWHGANRTAAELKTEGFSPDRKCSLRDGSSAGDWRLPSMDELCSLIDYGRRAPALPNGHMFSNILPGYYWSSTNLKHFPGLVWIVYPEAGTTCYDDVYHRAGYLWPVRSAEAAP